MLRSRGLSRLMNPRRIPLTLGTAVGAAFAATLIGLANAPAARADTEPEPFQDLFGDTGINSWTPSADASLLSSDPTLAGSLDVSVDNFQSLILINPLYDPVGWLADKWDPSAFSVLLTGPDQYTYLPVDAVGDLAQSVDFSVFASGLAPTLDPAIWDLVTLLSLF
jgi:hypothetical protein